MKFFLRTFQFIFTVKYHILMLVRCKKDKIFFSDYTYIIFANSAFLM